MTNIATVRAEIFNKLREYGIQFKGATLEEAAGATKQDGFMYVDFGSQKKLVRRLQPNFLQNRWL